MMILQGVRRRKPYIGVCYVNNPKKGGYTTLTPALDLTTSLPGDLGLEYLPTYKTLHCRQGIFIKAGWVPFITSELLQAYALDSMPSLTWHCITGLSHVDM